MRLFRRGSFLSAWFLTLQGRERARVQRERADRPAVARVDREEALSEEAEDRERGSVFEARRACEREEALVESSDGLSECVCDVAALVCWVL